MRKWNADVSAAARRAKAERGMSLVEATIILMVLAILTAVIAPSAGDFVSDARNVKGKEDVEAIAMSIARLQRDYGRKFLETAGGVDISLLLSGPGDGDSDGDLTDAELASVPGAKASSDTSWADGTTDIVEANRFLLDAVLVKNTATIFTAVSFNSGGGPRVGLGWRGPYMTGSVDLDPWGSRYQANAIHLSNNPASSTGHTNKAIVLSPGTNGVVETAFAGAGTGGGDDIIYVISGSTR